jgi:TfoX/Sxy family transcriptional regulator of competence genes
MQWKKPSLELGKLLEKAVKSFDCQKKMMFGSPVYTVNGNMFAGVHEDNIFIKLSQQEIQEILSVHKSTKPFEPMRGRIMKGYVVISAEIYSHPDKFHQWLGRSHRFALSLPPKERKPTPPKK